MVKVTPSFDNGEAAPAAQSRLTLARALAVRPAAPIGWWRERLRGS